MLHIKKAERHEKIHRSLDVAPELSPEEVQALQQNSIIEIVPAGMIQDLKDEYFDQDEDIWQRLRLQLYMPIPENKRVQRSKQWYIKNPQHLRAVSARAKPFMYLIVNEVEKRGLPWNCAVTHH